MTSTHGLIFLLVLICIPNALSGVEVTKAKKDEDTSLYQHYSDMNKIFKNLLQTNLKSVLRVFGELSQEFNVSSKCRSNGLKIFSGLRDLKLWAVSFIDATGKPSDGFLSGNFHMLGNYYQCLNSSSLKKNGEVDFRGQYCLITVKPYLPKLEEIPDGTDRIALVGRLTRNFTEVIRMYLIKSELFRIRPDKFGICVPSGCDVPDVQQLIQYASKITKMNFTVDFCNTEDSVVYFIPLRIVLTCIYAFFILLLFVGSAIDQYSRVKKIKFENPIIRILLCFSIITNFPKFMNTHETDKTLSSLNGIRVLSLFYVILGHHYLLKADSYMLKNIFITFLMWVKEFFFQIVTNGLYTVDVFFFIGGFLNCYVRVKRNFTQFTFPSAFMALVHRLFRLYPVLLSCYLLLFMLNTQGPMAQSLYFRYVEPCLTGWWRSVLFVNNFHNSEDQCFPQTWYLCCDMQFFLVSLITVPLLFRKPKIGVLVNSAVIFFSMLFTAVRVYKEKSAPAFIFTMGINEKVIRDFHYTFQSPFTHAASYFGGVLLGFFITRKTSFTIPKIIQFFGWIIASTMFCTMLFMTKRWNSGHPWTRLGSALYFSLSRPLYSWSVGWLIFCCATGHGGVINYLLSLKLWIPLNRMCLTMYLISPILQAYFFGNLKTPIDTQTDIEIWGYFGDVVIAFLVCLPFVFLFESPFIGLEKMIFYRKENTSELKENEMKETEITQHENGIKSANDKNSIKI